MSEQLFFTQTVEGLTRALGTALDADVARKLKDIGIDVYSPLLPAYPVEVWTQALEIGAAALRPDLPNDEAMYELGRRFINGFMDTLLGRAAMKMVAVMGPHRCLARMTRTFRSGNNFTETRQVELAPCTYDVFVMPVVRAHFIRGVLKAGLAVSGEPDATVTLISHSPEQTHYRVEWPLKG